MPLPDDRIYSDENSEALAALGLGRGVGEPVKASDVSKQNIAGHGALPPGVEDIETEDDVSDIEAAVTTVDTGPPYSIFRYISESPSLLLLNH